MSNNSSNAPSVLLTSPNTLTPSKGHDGNDEEGSKKVGSVNELPSLLTGEAGSTVGVKNSGQFEPEIQERKDVSSIEASDDGQDWSDFSLSDSNVEETKSSPEPQKEPKGFSRRFMDSLHRKAFRRNKSLKAGSGSLSSSPANENKLKVPKPVSRSRSLSRLPDVFSHVQNVFVSPSNVVRDTEVR